MGHEQKSAKTFDSYLLHYILLELSAPRNDVVLASFCYVKNYAEPEESKTFNMGLFLVSNERSIFF